MFSSKTNEWETPKKFFEELNLKYKFTLDPCCCSETAKCKKFYTKKEDGLKQSWKGEIVFCNPPYGKELKLWVKKCYEESRHAKIVMLIPARTDTICFHKYIYNIAKITFIKGRLKFGSSKNSAPFPSMLVEY
jgi:site-specific DNA-methyltransferase (adenine-specific)